MFFLTHSTWTTWYPKVDTQPATQPAQNAPYGCSMRSEVAPTITPPARVAFCTSTALNFLFSPKMAEQMKVQTVEASREM